MLDTDTASFIIRDRSPRIRRRLATIDPDEVCISAVTLGELRYGTARTGSAVHDSAVDLFVAHLHVLSWDASVCAAYGRLRAELERGGTPIGALDTMIAAHALHEDATLVTNNTRHFRRVKGLGLENWT